MGFDFPGEYLIYDAVIPFTENAVTYIPVPFPPRQDGGIDFTLFYYDCGRSSYGNGRGQGFQASDL